MIMQSERSVVDLKDGRQCEWIKLINDKGHYVELLTLGGIIKSIYVPDKEGTLENVVLEYATMDDYVPNPGFFNALIGRTGGRIHKGQITLGQTTYQLTTNQMGNTLHGGNKGIDAKVWEVLNLDETKGKVKLGCVCAHMEEGYPGNLEITVTYTWDNEDTLTISYEAETDTDTVVNLTNHAYFNLSGNAKRSIEQHYLKVKASHILELDEESIPTGKLLNVGEEKPFDFRTVKQIGQDIETANIQLQLTSGYDHPFVLDAGVDAVEMYDEESGRRMTMTTDQKAVVIYSMNFETPCMLTNGMKDIKRYAICFEAQGFPIGHNEVFRDEVVLLKGQHYKQKTSYTFSN